jgi:5,5'-dehydrodivanillate O-demethylase
MDQMERSRQKEEAFRLLTETSAGTPMGTLLRSFWQPIALSRSLAKGAARPVKVMGEELTLFRGESGKPYLVAGRCAHRCTVLHTGYIEGEQIRCMYHGWRYDGTGQCTEMPAERRGARPDLVKIAGYPLHEYAHLIFAWMGDAPAPEFQLPRKDVLENPDRHLFAYEETWDCHWFQQIENSLDATHVSFAHVWHRMSRFGEEITTTVPDLTYTETSAGIKQVAVRSKNNVRVSDWTFPNNNHVVVPGPKKGDPWSHICVWAVPIDERWTMRFSVLSSEGSDTRLQDEHDPGYQPAEHFEELFKQAGIPVLGSNQFLSVQDYVAVRGQGIIVDRMNETLAQSDMGVAKLRQMFSRELDAIRSGRPTKAWSRLEEAVELPIQIPETQTE